ncbi:hypothetical protein ACFYU8_18020 [Brevibacillus sp. NPDC003359]|uniref:hypothetical protein n=1 Tax=unclassified Brevibacillus TaxID=2684853 RepID=UPI00369FCAFA
MIQHIPAFLKPINIHAYRKESGELPSITGLFYVIPSPELTSRLCYEVTYADGEIDYVPVSDVESGNWEIVVSK